MHIVSFHFLFYKSILQSKEGMETLTTKGQTPTVHILMF